MVTRVQNLGKLRVYLSISVSKGLSTKLGMFFSALPWPAERRFESIKISLVLWERSGHSVNINSSASILETGD